MRCAISPGPLLIKTLLRSQDTNSTVAASSTTNDIVDPVTDREPPVSSDENTADDVDDLDQETDDTVTAFVNCQQNRLDVVFEENSGNVSLVDRLALLCHGILVGEDGPGVDAVHGGHDGKVILELVEVAVSRVDCAVERVDERGVEGTVRKLGDDVRKVELCDWSVSDIDYSPIGLTAMVEMVAVAHITVATSSDVKVTLHLVQIQTSVDTAAVGVAPESGCLCPLGPLLSKRNNVVNMLLAETLVFILWLVISLASNDSTLAIPSKLVNTFVVSPLPPKSLISAEALGRHNSIARSILNVYVNIFAVHFNHNIQVDLHFSRDAGLDLKVVRLGAAPPATKLTPDKDE